MPTNPAGLVYGTIAVGALLAAESARRETYAKTVGAVIVTLALYWLAHSYAEFTGRRLRNDDPFSFTEFGRTLVHELSVLVGAVIPLIALLICWATGTSLSAAVTVAIWTSAAMIVAMELTIGVRAELPKRELAMQTAFGAVLGLMVITLRVLLH